MDTLAATRDATASAAGEETPMYLPKQLPLPGGDAVVLEPLGEERYKVTDKVSAFYLLQSKDLADASDRWLPMGSIVTGRDEGDGWVRIMVKAEATSPATEAQKAATEEARELERLELDVGGVRKLGLTIFALGVHGRGVHEIDKGGFIDRWNRDNADRQISVGDIIIGNNDAELVENRKHSACAKGFCLRLTLLRASRPGQLMWAPACGWDNATEAEQMQAATAAVTALGAQLKALQERRRAHQQEPTAPARPKSAELPINWDSLAKNLEERRAEEKPEYFVPHGVPGRDADMYFAGLERRS